MDVFSDKKYEEMFASAGFKNIQVFSDWKKEVLPFSVPQELIILGEK